MPAAETYPDDLKYHREHDWARVEGDEAVLGITWFAQDSLGELVHFEAPDAGATVTKDGSYGEGWLVKVRLSEASELDSLLDSESYQSSLS